MYTYSREPTLLNINTYMLSTSVKDTENYNIKSKSSQFNCKHLNNSYFKRELKTKVFGKKYIKESLRPQEGQE